MYKLLLNADNLDKPYCVIDAKTREMFEHIVFHSALEEQENIQTKAGMANE